MQKLILRIILFHLIFIAFTLSAQEQKEIIFTRKNSPITIKYKQIYNNPLKMPKLYGGLIVGALNYYNPFVESGAYKVGLNGGFILNKKLSFDTKIVTLFPEDIIGLNEDGYGEPLYKSILHFDLTGHYNLFTHIKERNKDEVLSENQVGKMITKYIGKVPKKYGDNFAVDFGLNKMNYYDGSRMVFLEGPTDFFKVVQIANTSLVSSKIGISYLRTESRKFEASNMGNERAKFKRLYCYATYLINHKNEIVSFDYRKKNYEFITENIKKENSNLYNAIKINPVGFRIGFENKYFYSGKPNIFITLGLEAGVLPTIRFKPNTNLLNTIIMAHIGIGFFSKINK